MQNGLGRQSAAVWWAIDELGAAPPNNQSTSDAVMLATLAADEDRAAIGKKAWCSDYKKRAKALNALFSATDGAEAKGIAAAKRAAEEAEATKVRQQ